MWSTIRGMVYHRSTSLPEYGPMAYIMWGYGPLYCAVVTGVTWLVAALSVYVSRATVCVIQCICIVCICYLTFSSCQPVVTGLSLWMSQGPPQPHKNVLNWSGNCVEWEFSKWDPSYYRITSYPSQNEGLLNFLNLDSYMKINSKMFFINDVFVVDD